MRTISDELYNKLLYLGIINEEDDNTRNHNIGESDYSQHVVQPWTIWQEYSLNGWDCDIIKRVLRTKSDEPRSKDYEKIIHICQERIRQLRIEEQLKANSIDFENVE